MKPYKCGIGAKSFNHQWYLTQHQRILMETNHTNVGNVGKLLTCTQNVDNTGKSMLEKNNKNEKFKNTFHHCSSLIQHQRIYIEEKP